MKVVSNPLKIDLVSAHLGLKLEQTCFISDNSISDNTTSFTLVMFGTLGNYYLLSSCLPYLHCDC